MIPVTEELVLGLAGGSVPILLGGLGWLVKHLLTGKRRKVEIAEKQEEVEEKLLARVKASYEQIVSNLEQRIGIILDKVRHLERRREKDGRRILELTQHRDDCEKKLESAELRLADLHARLDTVEVQVRNGGLDHG